MNGINPAAHLTAAEFSGIVEASWGEVTPAAGVRASTATNYVRDISTLQQHANLNGSAGQAAVGATLTGKGVTVGIIDTGVDAVHPRLLSNYAPPMPPPPGLGRFLKPALIAVGAVALIGGVLWLNANKADTDFIVKFSAEPDYTPTTPSKMFERLQAHYQQYGVPVEHELQAMKDEGIVKTFWSGNALNGFLVTVAGGKDDEFNARMATLSEVGTIEKAEL